MPIAVETLAEPKTFPTTVGIVEKKPPFEMPFKITKAIKGPKLVEAGHKASMLSPVIMSDISKVLRAPSLSHNMPQPIRPTADEKLNPATSPAPVPDDKPIDFAYSGMKNGGTNNGNVPIAPPKKIMTNVNDLKSRLELLAMMQADYCELTKLHTTPQYWTFGMELAP